MRYDYCVATMSNVKRMEKSDRVDKCLRQFPQGKRIPDLAKKCGVSRTYMYDLLNTLDYQGKAHYERGVAYPGKDKEKPEAPKREDQERRGEASEIAQGMASLFPFFKPLKDFLKPE